jgi:hypothetical protein
MERKSESESEIAMCDRMQMYNIKNTLVAQLPYLLDMAMSQFCFFLFFQRIMKVEHFVNAKRSAMQ